MCVNQNFNNPSVEFGKSFIVQVIVVWGANQKLAHGFKAFLERFTLKISGNMGTWSQLNLFFKLCFFNLHPDFSGKTPFDLSFPQDLVELELRQIHEKQSRDDLQRRESIQRDPEVWTWFPLDAGLEGLKSVAQPMLRPVNARRLEKV